MEGRKQSKQWHMRWEEMQQVMEEIQNGERRSRAYLAASYLAVVKGHRGGGGEIPHVLRGKGSGTVFAGTHVEEGSLTISVASSARG